MEWHEALISLAAPDCPAAQTMRSGRLECSGHGGPARGQADLPGWDALDDDLMAPREPCTTCPARIDHGIVSQAIVRPGHVRLRVHAAHRQDIRQAYDALKQQGASIDRIRLGRHYGRRRQIDLDALTTRQWQALQEAAKMQYFQGCDIQAKAEHLAKAMGVSKSTAHEHLRKGLAALVAAVVETHA